MQITGWPQQVFTPNFIHKNRLYWQRHSTEVLQGKRSKTGIMTANIKTQLCELQVPFNPYSSRACSETLTSTAAHWWTRWGELWPAKCRSLRMMSPGSLPSNWLFCSSPSSSIRQDWSVEQLSEAGLRTNQKELLPKMVIVYTLWSVVISLCDLYSWTLKEQGRVN